MKQFYLVFVVLLFAFIGYKAYEAIPKDDKKALPCQEEVVTFTKIGTNKEFIEKSQKLLREGRYSLKGYEVLAEYSPSMLHTYITIDDLFGMLESRFPISTTKSSPLVINCKIYENDRDSPNKKSNSCKFYSGYIVLEFEYKGELVYKIQMDFIEKDKNEIQKRVDCMLDSFLNI